MLKNYLKTSFRNLLRHKSYTFINVFGLTVGLVTSIFTLLWILDELSYDRFNPNPDRLFRVLVNNSYPDAKIETYPATPAKLKHVIEQEIPEVELAAQYSFETELLIKHETKAYNEVGIYGDPTLFKILGFPILSGNETKPIIDIKSIAISERLAEKLFKNEDPIGKSLNLGASHELIVTSVFANIPQHSTLNFDFVAPFEIFIKENPWTQHWKSGGTRTTVLLKSSPVVEVVNQKFANLIKNNCPDCTTTPFLFPYVKSRLYNEFENGRDTGGRIQQLYLFGTVAILILVMACINFTNLSTARAASRSREVGIRKSIGAQKKGLIIQFISESLLLSFIGLVLAIVIVQLLLPFFNDVTNKSIRLDLSNPLFLAGILVNTLLCGLLAGSYPAFILSRFNPVNVLKGNTQLGLTGNTLRKSLVIIQFTASIILVIGSVAAYKQIIFISKKNLGFNKNNIIVVDQNEGTTKSYQAIKNELHQLACVKGVAFGGNNVFTIPIATADPVWAGKPLNSSILFKIYRCDAGFIPTLNIKIQSGRNFIDGQDASNYIINRKAAEIMGLSIETAVGNELEMWNGKGKIIGVTEDFHNNNLKFGIEPLIFMYSESVGAHYFIKLGSEQPITADIDQIESVFKKHNPDYPFEYTFLDDVFKSEYQAESVIGKLSLSFTVIAVLISCLGLFGLASFNAERRTKELGIRKVMGASVGNLVALLCGDFANLVLVSLFIAFPVSWYLVREYLSNYAFHAEIHWSIYILTSISMLLIVLLSIGYQSAKAAVSNPVDSLRNE
jgi:ABC-type antimicrobial peptide transport system permease subunit